MNKKIVIRTRYTKERVLIDNLKKGVEYKTENYELFKFIPGNRPIMEKHILTLARSLQKFGQFQPIIVNEDFFIIDGQHRLEGHKRIKDPVTFSIVPGNKKNGGELEQIKQINTQQRGWTWRQYERMYATQGNENYINYRKIRRRFGFSHTALLSIIYYKNSVPYHSEFREGHLKCSTKEDITNIIDICSKITDYWKLISRGYQNIRGKSEKNPPAKLIRAIIQMMKHSKFSYTHFLKKLKSGNVNSFVGINTTEEFFEKLVAMYNWNIKDSSKIIDFKYKPRF